MAALLLVACNKQNPVVDDNAPEWVEAIDLGLSVKWSNCNLGASTPEGFGNYFAWGDVEPIYDENYEPKHYKWWTTDGQNSGYTKYCSHSSNGYNGFTDYKTMLDSEDDAAHANWGGRWRMPTVSECRELLENCTATWTTLYGIEGRLFTSNISGYTDRWIFFPASGSHGSPTHSEYSSGYPKPTIFGTYWSSTVITEYDSQHAYSINLDSFEVSCKINDIDCLRVIGRTIRPVMEK